MSDATELREIKLAYDAINGTAQDYCRQVVQQLERLCGDAGLVFAVPVQWRVKSWESISDKYARKELRITNPLDLDDLCGVRAILLFRRDVETVRDLVRANFEVLEEQDTATRLAADQFGYTSIHLEIRVPDSWLMLPTLRGVRELRVELQIRSVAQHLWAATSHVLQYKKEADVPESVRRSIHRVSALLELIDLEYERALLDREQYRELIREKPIEQDELLNVDLLEAILKARWPAENLAKNEHSQYGELLNELLRFDVKTVNDLESLLMNHRQAALDDDAERINRGLKHFWQVGLTRMAMRSAFGQAYVDFQAAQVANAKPKRKSPRVKTKASER